MKKLATIPLLLVLFFLGCQKDNSLLPPEQKSDTQNMLWNIGAQHNEILKSGISEIDKYLQLTGKKAGDLTNDEFYELTFVYSKNQVKNLNEFTNVNLDETFNTKNSKIKG